MATQKKINQVDEVANKISTAKSAALVQYQGLNAADTTDLRANIKNAGGSIEVVKNSLITRALEKLGITLPEVLTGPTAITYCETDEIAALKEVDKVNKAKDKTSFKYGIYDKKLLSFDELKSFLNLPSKSALLSRLVGDLRNPLQRLVFAGKYNQTRLALALKAVAEKQK